MCVCVADPDYDGVMVTVVVSAFYMWLKCCTLVLHHKMCAHSAGSRRRQLRDLFWVGIHLSISCFLVYCTETFLYTTMHVRHTSPYCLTNRKHLSLLLYSLDTILSTAVHIEHTSLSTVVHFEHISLSTAMHIEHTSLLLCALNTPLSILLCTLSTSLSTVMHIEHTSLYCRAH